MKDMDNSAAKAVAKGHHYTHGEGDRKKPYAIVVNPSGTVGILPLDQCRVEPLEIMFPPNEFPITPKVS